ncbi:KAT8 regulatory NSL complex subunit 1-like protein isoform X2 [Mixophyes fleayi]|uniref:KAT8 regulatory NSL complex subunit 1-like protein isoform X2 n=1 Tax=Mixophyes fleayi TaxID=3061075 RepID=UPI003F4DB053
MTPALTETAPQEPGVHLSPSLGIRSLSKDANLCADTSKPNSKANSSSVVYPGTELCSQKDFTSLKQVESLSSARYQTVFILTSGSGLNLQNQNNTAWKTEQDTRRQRFHSKRDSRPLLAERKVKRELFPGTVSKVLADVNKLWDITVTEAGGIHGLPVQKYRLNGRIEEESLAIPFTSNCFSPDLMDLENAANKESAAKLVFLRCLNQQQALLNRAQRNKKRLQLLLANYAVEHCSRQISGFVNYQIEKLKVHRNSASQPSRETETNSEALVPVGVASGPCMDFEKALCQAKSSAIRKFSVPTAAFISRIGQELDSDATESSSDDDCDEESRKTDCNAEWNWLSARANVGSRWTWLQAQISELEYKIQQLVNLQSQIRRNKGTLVFEKPSNYILKEETHHPDKGILLRPAERLVTPPEETNLPPANDLEMSPSSPTLLLRNIEKQSAQLTEMVSSLITAIPISLSPTQPVKPFTHEKLATGSHRGTSKLHKAGAPIFNGFCKQQPVKNRKRIRVKASSTLGRSSARTRPLQLFYKRNLYRLGAGYTPINVALRLPKTVYCCNQSQQTSNHSWISCDKRQKPVLLEQNVCEIDPHFHPVLSLPSELPLYLHLEALLKSNIDIKGDAADNTLFTQEADGYPSHATAQWSTGCTSSFRLQSSYDTCKEERRPASVTETDTHPVTVSPFSHAAQADDTNRTPSSQKSSVQTRDPSIVFSVTRRRLKSENAYDIDNIVIPMSLVAPTKVEKLQYKEIITPSWKEVVHERLEISPNEELEDLSDEAYSSRHQKYEQKEKARWSLWEQSKWPKRSRYSSHSVGVWSANLFISNEESCSPSSLSPVSLETLSPSADSSQNLQSADELQQEKIECWERRTFPLTETAAVTLLETQSATKHASNSPITPQLPMHVDYGEQCFHSRSNSSNR